MKRVFAVIICFVIFSLSGLNTLAHSVTENNISGTSIVEETEYYSDGSYTITTITVEESRSTKKGTKTQSHYSSDDVLEWAVKVQGTFTYNGTTVACTSASHSVTIYNTAWYAHSQSSYTSGNKAIADFVMKRKLLGIVVSTRNINLELACDKNGNLS